MIDLHYWPTPNGWKISIMLEECGLPYKLVPVNIGAGDQFKPEFLKISPNNRMPAIVDHEPPGGGAPVSVFESGAILQYLAEKAGKFLPKELHARYDVLQWLYWQMGGLGPMAGQAGHFNVYAPQFAPAEQLVYGQKRYSNEVNRLYGVFDRRHGDLALGGELQEFRPDARGLSESQEVVRRDRQATGRGEGPGGRRRLAPGPGHPDRGTAQSAVRPDCGGRSLTINRFGGRSPAPTGLCVDAERSAS